jgi:hypothetical protein
MYLHQVVIPVETGIQGSMSFNDTGSRIGSGMTTKTNT